MLAYGGAGQTWSGASTAVDRRKYDAYPGEAEMTGTVHEFFIKWWRPATINRLMFTTVWNRIRLQKEAAEMIGWYGRETPKATGKRRVTILVLMSPRMRPVDADALFKSTLDGLVAAGLLQGDRCENVELAPLEQRPVRDDEEWGTMIRLEDLP